MCKSMRVLILLGTNTNKQPQLLTHESTQYAEIFFYQ